MSSSSFTTTRPIDIRDKKNKFARRETSDTINEISKYCKKICINMLKYIVNMLKHIYKSIISWFTIKPSYNNELSYNTGEPDEQQRAAGYTRRPVFTMREKMPAGVYKLDEVYEPREKEWTLFKNMHDEIIKKFHARDFYGCMDACNKYIRETGCPAYMNHCRATSNEKEVRMLITMFDDAIKYSSQSLILA